MPFIYKISFGIHLTIFEIFERWFSTDDTGNGCMSKLKIMRIRSHKYDPFLLYRNNRRTFEKYCLCRSHFWSIVSSFCCESQYVTHNDFVLSFIWFVRWRDGSNNRNQYTNRFNWFWVDLTGLVILDVLVLQSQWTKRPRLLKGRVKLKMVNGCRRMKA